MFEIVSLTRLLQLVLRTLILLKSYIVHTSFVIDSIQDEDGDKNPIDGMTI